MAIAETSEDVKKTASALNFLKLPGENEINRGALKDLTMGMIEGNYRNPIPYKVPRGLEPISLVDGTGVREYLAKSSKRAAIDGGSLLSDMGVLADLRPEHIFALNGEVLEKQYSIPIVTKDGKVLGFPTGFLNGVYIPDTNAIGENSDIIPGKGNADAIKRIKGYRDELEKIKNDPFALFQLYFFTGTNPKRLDHFYRQREKELDDPESGYGTMAHEKGHSILQFMGINKKILKNAEKYGVDDPTLLVESPAISLEETITGKRRDKNTTYGVYGDKGKQTANYLGFDDPFTAAVRDPEGMVSAYKKLFGDLKTRGN